MFVFDKLLEVLNLDFDFEDKDLARRTMFNAQDLFRNFNYAAEGTDEYQQNLAKIDEFIAAKGRTADEPQLQNAE